MSERPTHIRITGPTDAMYVTVGGGYEVTGWYEDGSPFIRDDDGDEVSCAKPDGSDASRALPSWEPAKATDALGVLSKVAPPGEE